jgi:hypothetical protein
MPETGLMIRDLVREVCFEIRQARRRGEEVSELAHIADAIGRVAQGKQLDARVAKSTDPLPGRRTKRGQQARTTSGRDVSASSTALPGSVPMSNPRCDRAVVGAHVTSARKSIGARDFGAAKASLVSALAQMGREWISRDANRAATAAPRDAPGDDPG